MIKFKFDPTKPYQVITYARMSTDTQNPCSPEQQQNEIDERLRRKKLPWTTIKNYVDRGISGRYAKKRPGYQQMLRDIRSGNIKPDLILVDTQERLGRSTSMAQVRLELQNKYGVLILSADSDFSDPTSTAGQINSAFQEIRGSEENRVKSHQVMRGKKDAVRKGYWPGGPAPRGFDLQLERPTEGQGQYGARTKLIPNTEQAYVLRLLFERAKETNHGAGRLAKFLNEHEDISQDLKPFFSTTVDYWLQNRLYIGEFVFNKYSLDVVEDCRVRNRNDEEDLLVIPHFCEAIVPEELFNEVQALRHRRKRPKDLSSTACKLIKPILLPTSVKYALAGFVRCGSCGASMVPTSHGSDTEKRQAYYRCPRRSEGNCENKRHVSADWLEHVVFDELKRSLIGDSLNPSEIFGADESSPLALSTEIELLIAEVQNALQMLQQPDHSPIPSLQQQITELSVRIQGYLMSISSINLSSSARELLERQLSESIEKKRTLENRVCEIESIVTHSAAACNQSTIIARLTCLSEILQTGNPSRLNLELSLHIDKIDCHKSGDVVLRTCKLGAFRDALPLLAVDEGIEDELVPLASPRKVKPRRRATLRLQSDGEDENELQALAEFAADPNRFAGINEKWFHERTFSVPVPMGWAEKNARIVAEKRKQGLTEQAIAVEQNVSLPTVRKALKIAKKTDPELALLPRKMPRPRWHETHADEVFRRKQAGESLESLARQYKKCEETLRKAVVLGRNRAEELNSAT